MIDEITMQVKDLLATRLGAEVNSLTDHTSFTNDLGADSLDVLETFMEIEKEFKITITDEDAEKLTTVGSLINYIKQQIK